MTCSIGNGFAMGFDPHTVTAYKSPNSGDAIALISSALGTAVARIDLTLMLALPEASAGSHTCASGTLPGSVVTFFPVP